MFFFKRKKIVVDCFTNRPEVYEYAAIKPAKEFIPNWWKKLPLPEFEGNELTLGNKRNMKGCVGFTHHYRYGFMMPLWSDLRVNIGAKGGDGIAWQFSDRLSDAEWHDAAQSGDFYDIKDFQHLKLVAPWLMKSNRYVEMNYVMPFWNMGDLIGRVTIMPGTIDAYYQPVANINMMFRREPEEYTVTIPHGMPLLHMIPLSEHKVVVKTHLVSNDEFINKHMLARSIKFNSKYNAIRKAIMKNESSKCPFGFKK